MKEFVSRYLQSMETMDTSSFEEIIHPEYRPNFKRMARTTNEIINDFNLKDYLGIDKLRERLSQFNQIWSEVKISDLELISENHTVIAYYTIHHRQIGPIVGLKATNKIVSVKTYQVFYFKDNKIFSIHMLKDFFSIIRQIGMEISPITSIPITDYLESLRMSMDHHSDLKP